jgi:hypothetical protein
MHGRLRDLEIRRPAVDTLVRRRHTLKRYQRDVDDVGFNELWRRVSHEPTE